MKIRMIAFSRRGCVLAQKICETLDGHDCEIYSKTSSDAEGTIKVDGPATAWTEESFKVSDAIIFIGATAIAVRYIAPFLKSKTSDPAVISVDEMGKFVIPLLSGHIGGANDLAEKISEGIGAVPIITTATDIHGRFSVDSFAVKNNLHIGSMSAAKDISSQIVDDKKVGLVSDVPILNGVPPELDLNGNEDTGIFISYCASKGPFKRTLKLTPRCHVLGIGCRRGVPADRIEVLVDETLKKENISIKSVRAVASIDLKNDEPGLKEFTDKIKAESLFFSSDELGSLPDIGFTASERVKTVTGVDNVCERAAYAASKNGAMVVKKTSKDGVTLAVIREPVCLDLMRW
ncbi:cobalamin biosynthesis protein CbiG [Candidatus Methanoplasma termitum]|uniref:Cobalamin biosynthesis protein CbiG n=1 Tax=Candidatus Methanoplasma termitum TaxID=1577791 RepID=A0A0A7LBU4_9ARCH|nr:cobalt-precorrin 5A hydrolase [Candidatus Methanoplasma termitum]AIZ56600.1 cobalamin biosynthesis protein CbiG [Candidatus Methanoplasma termitum]MCL2333848.1 cobalt-precorrin 5A hydrolase [Candidatus Methanoplasma sp.]